MDDVIFWTVAVAVSGSLAIWGKSDSRMPLHWGFKPLPAALLIGAVWTLTPVSEARTWVIAALAMSLVGDVILMLPKRLFAVGLVGFLCALVAYIVAFSIDVSFSLLHLPLLLVPVVPAAFVLRALYPHVGRLRPAVAIYVIMMVVLVWRLLVRYGSADLSVASYVFGCLGGGLFMTADSLLALRRFAGFKVPYPLELGPYFLAQWCLAAATWS